MPGIEPYVLQELRNQPIEEVAERLGIEVKRHRCLCPFHDDHHPSAAFKGNRMRCFSCGASADTIALVEQVKGLGFKEACEWLAQKTLPPAPSLLRERESSHDGGVKPTLFDASRYERVFDGPRLSEVARRFLFEERRLDERVVRWCRLTSWLDKSGTEWLSIPYFDTEWRLVGIQNRNMLSKAVREERGLPRFRFPRGSRISVYNMPVLGMLSQGEPLYITEGPSDCWAMLSSGHKAIAIPSATGLRTEDAQMLQSLCARLETPFHMYPDQDEPGEQLFRLLKERLPNLVRHELPEGVKDYGEWWRAFTL